MSTVVVLSSADMQALREDADRRQSRDSQRNDDWGRGHIPTAHLSGMMLEYATAKYFGWAMDWGKHYDGGKDFTHCGLRWDCKSTVTMDMPAVREVELKRHKADAYVFGKSVPDESRVTVFGWLSKGQLEKQPRVEKRSGWCRQPEWKALRCIDEIKDASRGANVLRYPGGKSTILESVWAKIPLWGSLFQPSRYVEPFVGGGAMLLRVLDKMPAIACHINDLDRSLALLYQAIKSHRRKLVESVMSYHPTVDAWYRSKEIDGKESDPVKAGLAKLILHYCSHAGRGYTSGGPQGGKLQQSDYKIGCRWSPLRIVQTINWLSPRLRNATITNGDFADIPLREGDFVFCDPPYVAEGPGLYRHSMSQQDHVRLRDFLASSEADWAVTYDDHELVRHLYRAHRIESFKMTTGNNHQRKYNELVITREQT